jgi:biotin carboxylase
MSGGAGNEGPAVIVDPYSSGALFAPAFREFGVEPVAVLSGPQPPDVYASSYRPKDFAEVITFTGDPAPVVQRLRELRPRCILTGCESGVEMTDLIAPLVQRDLANVPELKSARRHKGAMAQAAQAAGLATIKQICTSDIEAVAAWIERSGLTNRDLVVKPPKSASTDGVVRVCADQDWRGPFLAALGATNRLGIVNDEVIVQEYAVGTEFVVDTVSVAGRHSITDLCRYAKVDNGGHMAIYDRMEWLPYDRGSYGELFDYALRVLDAVGMRTGAAHVEIMATPDGPRLIEIGARPHGGGQPKFCRIATGDSQVDRLVRCLAGGGELEEGFALARHVCVVFFIARAAGIVRNADPYRQVTGLPTFHDAVIGVRTGDRIEATRDLFGTLDLGFVVLAGEDQDQVRADYEAVRIIERNLEVEPDVLIASHI